MIDSSNNNNNNNNLLCNSFKNISLVNNNNDINNYNEVLFWKVFKNMYLNKYIFRMVEEINENIVRLNPTIQRKKFNNIKSIKWMLENKAYELLKYKLSINEIDLIFDLDKRMGGIYTEVKFEDVEVMITSGCMFIQTNKFQSTSKQPIFNNNKLNDRLNKFIEYYTSNSNSNSGNGFSGNNTIFSVDSINVKFNQLIKEFIQDSQSNDEYLSRLNSVKDNRFKNEFPPTWNALLPMAFKYSGLFKRVSINDIKTFKWIIDNSNYDYFKIFTSLGENCIKFNYPTSSIEKKINYSEEEEKIISIIQNHQNLNELSLNIIVNIIFTTYSVKLLKLIIQLSNNNNNKYHQQINNHKLEYQHYLYTSDDYLDRIAEFIEFYITIDVFGSKSFNNFILIPLIKNIKPTTKLNYKCILENIFEKQQHQLNQNSIELIIDVMYATHSIKLLKLLITISNNNNKYYNIINNYSIISEDFKLLINNSKNSLDSFAEFYTSNCSINGIYISQLNGFICEFIESSTSNDEYISRLAMVKDNTLKSKFPPTWNELIKNINIYSHPLQINITTLKWILENSNHDYFNRIHSFLNKHNIKFKYSSNKSESTEEEEIISVIQTHQDFNEFIIQLILDITFTIYSTKLLKSLIEISNNNKSTNL